jgi:hypothetical protein
MKKILAAFLLAATAGAGERDDEVLAAKERIHALLEKAAYLEKEGRPDEAERLRAEAGALKEKIHARLEGQGDDPLKQALHNLEKAIGSLEKAGCKDLAGDLRGAADRVRGQIKEREAARARGEGKGPRSEEVEFWRRNIDTLRLAMKALAEGERRDAMEIMERAIHAREVMISGRQDEEAWHILKRGPDDAAIAEMLQTAAGLWREYRQPKHAERVQELANYLVHRAAKGKDRLAPEKREWAGPDGGDRLERLEERIARLERAVHELIQHLERERAG